MKLIRLLLFPLALCSCVHEPVTYVQMRSVELANNLPFHPVWGGSNAGWYEEPNK
jgi:hypothetical protein